MSDAPSLIDRLRGARPRGEAAAAALLALLVVAVPGGTIAGAALLTARAERAGASRGGDAAGAMRAGLAPAFARVPAARILAALARALPADAALARVQRGADGRLHVAVMTNDPDRLRAALRREADLRTLRDVGQRRGDAGVIVTLEGGS